MTRRTCRASAYFSVVLSVMLLAGTCLQTVMAEEGTFVPPHNDFGSDTDVPPDGLYNILVLEVHVDITIGGFFILEGYLYAPDDTLVTYASDSRTLGVGAQTWNLNFPGDDISGKGKDGPYTIYLGLYDRYYNTLDSDTYTTKTYTADQFQVPPAMLYPPHSDMPVDTDGDSYYDFLAVDVKVKVNYTAYLKVTGNLYDSAETTLIDQKQVTGTYSSGFRTIRLNFSGFMIRTSGLDGPYLVRLWLYNSGGNVLSTGTHDTDYYDHTDFELQPAVLVAPHLDFGIDLDSNALYDYLIVVVNVNIIEAGTFTFTGELWENVGANPAFIAYNENTTTFGVGAKSVWLHFLGYSIKTAGVNGKYRVVLTILDSRGATADAGEHLTKNYNANTFDVLPAVFSPPHSDTGIDLNSNSLYDYLAVNASLSVKVSMPYLVQASLFNSDQTVFICDTENMTNMIAGSRKLPLWFEGMKIRNSTIPGPYLSKMYLYDSFNNLLNMSSHQTSSYPDTAFEEFKTPDTTPPSISAVTATPSPQEAGQDVNVSAVVTDNIVVKLVSLVVKGPLGEDLGSFLMNFDPANGRYYLKEGYAMVGTCTFTIFAEDLAGNKANESGQFVLGDLTSPAISDLRVEPPNVEVPGSVNISAVVTDNHKVKDVTLQLVGVGNYPMSFDTATGRHFHNSSFTAPAPHPFSVLASDPSNNWRTASGRFNATDTTRPSISDLTVDPTPQQVFGNVNVSALLADNYMVQGAWLDISGFGNFSMMYDQASTRYFLMRSYGTIATYPFVLWAEDSVGNWNSATGNIVIDDMIPPSIQDVRVVPTEQRVGGIVNISAIITDNHILASASIQVFNQSGSKVVDQQMTFDPATSRYYLSRGYSTTGLYTFNITARDLGDNIVNASGFFLISTSVPDVTPPTIDAHSASPDPQEVHGSVRISASVRDDIQVSFVKVAITSPTGGDLGNLTMDFDGSAYYNEATYDNPGTHKYCIWAEDTSSNPAKACGSFVIEDLEKPVIQSPLASPSPQQVHGEVNITAEVTDNHVLTSVQVEIRTPIGSLVGNFSMPLDQGSGKRWFRHAYSDLGTHSFTITAIDFSDNVAVYVGSFLIQDTTKPVAEAGPDVTIDFGQSVTLDGHASSDNDMIESYTWKFSDGAAPIVLDGAVRVYKFLNWGVFTVTLTVKDRAGNEGTDSLKVTVNKPPEPPSPPRPPTNLAVTVAGLGSLRLTWTAPTQRENGSALTDLKGYDVYRSDSPGPPYVKMNAALVTETNYTDSGLQLGATYHYAVKAIDADDMASNYSSEASGTVPLRGSIRGKVIDETNNPIWGATAFLMSGSVILRSVATDNLGNFSFMNVDAGSYTLKVAMPNYEPREMPIDAENGKVTDAGVIVLYSTVIQPPVDGSSFPWAAVIAVIIVIIAVLVVVPLLLLRRRRSRRRTNRRGR